LCPDKQSSIHAGFPVRSGKRESARVVKLACTPRAGGTGCEDITSVYRRMVFDNSMGVPDPL